MRDSRAGFSAEAYGRPVILVYEDRWRDLVVLAGELRIALVVAERGERA